MYYLVLAIHIIVCFFLIVVILLQSGKAADLAGAFGGMGSQTAFGPRGSATLLSKATTLSAVLFMVTSLTLSIMATRSAGLATTVLEDTKSAPAKTAPAPAAPVPSPAQQAPVQAPGKTMTMTPEGGKTVEIPLPPADGKMTPATPGTPANQTPPAPPKK